MPDDMWLHSLAFKAYDAIRKIIRATGLMGPIRRLIGPAAGRFLFRLSPGAAGPVQIHGHRMYLASPGRFPPVNMSMGRYEPRTTQLFKEILQPGMVVIDIGAHVGYYTLIAAKQVSTTGRFYAFEPDQDNHSLLLKNIELNGYDNVTVTNKAVSDRVGRSELFLTNLDSGRHSMYHHGLPERGSVSIDTTTVDSFLESEKWPTVDVVKIDVEGAEVTVLTGMAELLKRSANLKLIIEFNPALLQGGGVAPLDFLEMLASFDWSVHNIEEETGLSPLAEDDALALVESLLAADSSVNLFCARL